MPVSNQLAEYDAWMRAAGTAPQTLRLRLHYLNRLADTYPGTALTMLTSQQLAGFLAHRDWAPETRKSARSAIRSFFRWAVDIGRIDQDQSRSLPRVRIPAGAPRPAPAEIFDRALSVANERERLMLLLAAFAGLRRAEIARVHTDDVGEDELRVVGKGNRVRLVPLHPVLKLALASATPGYLFPGQDDGHLTPGHVGVLIKRLLGPKWSAHTLRHKFATSFFDMSKDILLTMQMLGHTKPETTARYVLADRSRAAAFIASL